MCTTCRTLAARNEELEAELDQLKSKLYARHYEPPGELNLTGSQRRMLACMLRYDRPVTREFLFDATRGEKGTQANILGEKTVDTHLSHLRTKLRPFKLEIETVWGVGWRLSSDTRTRLLNWNKPEAKAA